MTHEQRQYLKHAVSEALKARIPKPKDTCTGCGTAWHNYTENCRQCWTRKAKRTARGERIPHRPGHCAGCDQPYYETTPGCHRCHDRHLRRTKRGATARAKHMCKRCGTPFTDRTPKPKRECVLCYERLRIRKKRHAKR